jgi:myo-inositol-1(or 4)-monophosphatase
MKAGGASGSVLTIEAPEMAVALAAAIAAGALLRAAFERPGRTHERRKGAHDVVTAADRASEALIMARLATAFPTDRRLGEESGLRNARRRGAGPTRTWIVDPLDGTVNFASALPFWCVSIALAIDGTAELGVIHDPLRDETFAALRGRGAWRVPAGEPLDVRRLARLADAVVILDPGSVDDPEADDRLRIMRTRVRAVRALGSIALSLASLAAGRLDGVVQVRGLQAVDVAAAGLIAAEAGARVTDADGGPWLVIDGPARGTGIAAARPGLHRRLLAAVSAAPIASAGTGSAVGPQAGNSSK